MGVGWCCRRRPSGGRLAGGAALWEETLPTVGWCSIARNHIAVHVHASMHLHASDACMHSACIRCMQMHACMHQIRCMHACMHPMHAFCNGMHADACVHMHAIMHAFCMRQMHAYACLLHASDACAGMHAIIIAMRSRARAQNFKAISKRIVLISSSLPLGARIFREPEQRSRSSSSFAQVFKFTPSLGRELELSVTDARTHARIKARRTLVTLSRTTGIKRGGP